MFNCNVKEQHQEQQSCKLVMRAQQKPIIDKQFYKKFNDIIAAFQLNIMCTQDNFPTRL